MPSWRRSSGSSSRAVSRSSSAEWTRPRGLRSRAPCSGSTPPGRGSCSTSRLDHRRWRSSLRSCWAARRSGFRSRARISRGIVARLEADPSHLPDDAVRRLGTVLVLSSRPPGPRVVAAHYLRPTERDGGGHLQRASAGRARDVGRREGCVRALRVGGDPRARRPGRTGPGRPRGPAAGACGAPGTSGRRRHRGAGRVRRPRPGPPRERAAEGAAARSSGRHTVPVLGQAHRSGATRPLGAPANALSSAPGSTASPASNRPGARGPGRRGAAGFRRSTSAKAARRSARR